MRSFEIRRFDGEDRIFIDNQLFDWGLDENALEEINKVQDKQELEKIHINIRNFFLECLSNQLGKKVTMGQVLEAIELGYLE
jgi:hypothetical protein